MLFFIISLGIGSGIAYVLNLKLKNKIQNKLRKVKLSADQEASTLLKEAENYCENIQKNISALQEFYDKKIDLFEKKIELKEQSLEKKEHSIDSLSTTINDLTKDSEKLQLALSNHNDSMQLMLADKAGFAVDKVLDKIKQNLEADYQDFFEQTAKKHLQNYPDYVAKEAVENLKYVIQKFAEPSSVDKLDKTIKVDKDVLKGRLIGKGAKNLLYIEEKTNVDIVFEDQEGLITVSYYNLVTQEMVRLAIKKLLRKSVINPEVIDETLKEAQEELDDKLIKIGNKAADIIGIENRDPELMKLVGRLKYRTSYGQNILYHSLEIAYFSALMAAEIGADIEIAKLGGFYHDLGKAIDQEVEGSHDYLSKVILEKFNYSDEIVHAAWTHHDAIPIETVEAQIVKAADAISAGRPGARTESAQRYIERIQKLESMALDRPQVKKAFAISAGRELRTIVDENKIVDSEMQALADELAKSIEKNLAYPGQVKVNLIRKIERVEFANKKTKS